MEKIWLCKFSDCHYIKEYRKCYSWSTGQGALSFAGAYKILPTMSETIVVSKLIAITKQVLIWNLTCIREILSKGYLTASKGSQFIMQ